MSKNFIFSASLILLLLMGCQPKLSKEEADELSGKITSSGMLCANSKRVKLPNEKACNEFKQACAEAKEKAFQHKFCEDAAVK